MDQPISNGTVSNISSANSEKYFQIKQKALQVEELYLANGITIPSRSDLAALISSTKELSDSWHLGQVEKTSINLLFMMAHFNRIADAILFLENEKDCSKYLKVFISGHLNFLNRKKSRAKNILWEIELWASLKRMGFNVSLDEPDINIIFGDSKISIACKKFYSEGHVQNVLSKAISQIEADSDIGIVAINLDDLVPEEVILKAPNQAVAAQVVNKFNEDFLKRHERHFQKYLTSGRIISALVSTAVLADFHQASTRFNNVRQATIWTIPGLPEKKDKILRKFYNQLMK